MKLKRGVELDLIDKMYECLYDLEVIWRKHGAYELIITSGSEGYGGDGIHKKNSKHYTGEAIDIRIWNQPNINSAVKSLRERFDVDFDVVLESNHVHFEYDPKEVS